MNKKRKKIIKKTNSFKKQLKTNLSLLKKHVYNYKLEISLSVLILLIIFLISLLYPNSYVSEKSSDTADLYSASNANHSIDDYLSVVEIRDGDIEYFDDDDFKKEEEARDDIDVGINEDTRVDEDNEINEDNIIDTSFVNSFGDSFSSGAFLNKEETNMYLDDISTALTFEPLYDFSRVGSCEGKDCNFKRDISILDYGMEACLRDTNNCLKVINESIYYNGKEIELPEKIRREDLISLSVGALESKFLLGAVLAQDEDEYGLVYSFDGSDFLNIISNTSNYNIRSKYQRQGGRIGFGGSDDNYIIFYAGYSAKAFQVIGDEIVDISQMFGLRVTNKGFIPQILQSGSGNDSTWYICSLDKDNPKFIKLWQNNTNYIQGSLDLSSDIYTSSNLYDNFDYCYLSNNEDKKVYLSFRSNNANSNLKSLNIWQFKDNGFDNSYDYKVVSADILGKDNYVASNAVIKEIGLSANEKRYSNNINDFGSLYLSTDNNDWQRVDVGQRVFFDENTKNLYWRLDLSSADNYFSPWLDHVNRLDYLLTKIK
jgi:hypothetical protein